jgi:hypothetical protein
MYTHDHACPSHDGGNPDVFSGTPTPKAKSRCRFRALLEQMSYNDHLQRVQLVLGSHCIVETDQSSENQQRIARKQAILYHTMLIAILVRFIDRCECLLVLLD